MGKPHGAVIDPRYQRATLAPERPDIQTLLVRVGEEAGEVVQAAAKALRWGIHSWHPDHPERGDNLHQLRAEVADLNQLMSELEFILNLRHETPGQ